MPVTRLGQPITLLNSGLGQSTDVPGGGTSGQVVTSNGSNGSYWGPNVATITSNGSNLLAGPFISLLSGTGVIFSVSSNALTIGSTATGGGAGTITTKEEGSTLSTTVTTLDFVGAGVTATGAGATTTVTIPGGGAGATAFIGARVYNSSTIAVNPSASLTFNSERFDTDGFHSTSANTERLTIPAGMGGKYLVTFVGEWVANATGYRQFGLRVNGSTYIGIDVVDAVVGGQETRQTVSSGPYDFAAGDYVEVIAAQTSGGSLNVTSGAAYTPEFSIVKLDSGKVGAGIGAKATNTAGTSIADAGSPTAMPFATEDFDTDGFHDNSTNNSRLTVPAGLAGKYLITGQYTLGTANIADAFAQVYKNGTTSLAFTGRAESTAAGATGYNVSAVADLVAGDYIQLNVYQNSGGAKALEATAGYNWLSIMRLDSGSNTADTVLNQVGNGSVIIPGLAANPDINVAGANDDEFDTTDTSDPITGWTTLGTPNGLNTNSTAKSHLFISRAAAAGTGLTGVYKAWTPSNGHIWTAKLAGMSGLDAENIAGLAMFDGPSGVAHLGGIRFSGARVSQVGVFTFTTPTGTLAVAIAAGDSPIPLSPLYIRLVYTSSTSWQWYFSQNGIIYSLFHSYNPGFTPDSVGLFVQSSNASFAVTSAFDWIRRT